MPKIEGVRNKKMRRKMGAGERMIDRFDRKASMSIDHIERIEEERLTKKK